MTELFIFARFQAREGQAEAVLAALHEVAGPTRQEPGCLAMNYFRATRDPNAIFLHSRWTDEAAFELHAGYRHTVKFLEEVAPLVDHELEITRTLLIS